MGGWVGERKTHTHGIQEGSGPFPDVESRFKRRFPIFPSDPRQEASQADKLHCLIKHPS